MTSSNRSFIIVTDFDKSKNKRITLRRVTMSREDQIRLLEEALEEARGWWDFDLCERLEQALHDLREYDGE